MGLGYTLLKINCKQGRLHRGGWRGSCLFDYMCYVNIYCIRKYQKNDNTSTKTQRMKSLSVTGSATRGRAAKIIDDKQKACFLRVLQEPKEDKSV